MTYKNFPENLQKFKTELKLFAEFIKAYKKDCKGERDEDGNRIQITKNREAFSLLNKGWKPPYGDYSYQYRHMHIAYSLLRGRTMRQIENKIREGNEPDKALIETYVYQFMKIKDFFKNLMTFRRNKPVIKMYVLVREDMAPEARMVQGGHAVAQFLLEHAGALQTTTDNGKIRDTWNNGYMIYLGVKDEQELSHWEAKLKAAEKAFATFVEPDWGDPTKTALACVDFGEIFAGLELLNLEPNEEEFSEKIVAEIAE